MVFSIRYESLRCGSSPVQSLPLWLVSAVRSSIDPARFRTERKPKRYTVLDSIGFDDEPIDLKTEHRSKRYTFNSSGFNDEREPVELKTEHKTEIFREFDSLESRKTVVLRCSATVSPQHPTVYTVSRRPSLGVAYKWRRGTIFNVADAARSILAFVRDLWRLAEARKKTRCLSKKSEPGIILCECMSWSETFRVYLFSFM